MRYPPGYTPEWETRLSTTDFQLIARTADDLGYDAIQVPEHIVMPNDLATMMGAYWPHAFTAMAFIAGATTRLAVNASVIVLPYHEPITLAKAVATLDVLSGGRVVLSVGVGHAEDEFRALGVPFEKRGRIADEYLEVMKVLWTEDAPCYEGEFVSSATCGSNPSRCSNRTRASGSAGTPPRRCDARRATAPAGCRGWSPPTSFRRASPSYATCRATTPTTSTS